MKKNKCLSCGANIDPKSLRCEYCGAYPTRTPKDLENKEVVKVTKISNDTLNVMLIKKFKVTTVIPLIAFMVLWCSVAFGMGITAISMGAPTIFGMVPFGMGIVGVVMIFSTILPEVKNNNKELINLYKKYEYKTAYALLKEKLAKNNSNQQILEQLIILGFYKMKEIKKVKEYILNLEIIGRIPNANVAKIASKLKVSYSPQSFYTSSYSRKYNGFNF